MQAELISIGTELTTGAVIDTNAPWLAERLTRLGVPVSRQVTLADSRRHIAGAIGQAATRAGLVVVTGGLGPTPDDLTRHALADAAGVPLERDEASAGRIAEFFAKIGKPMPESNLVQALVPAGARVLDNPHGTAPGLALCVGRAMVFALPGVPREMKPMFENAVEPWVRAQGGTGVAVRALRTFGAGESRVAEQLGDLLDPGRNPAVGTTAGDAVITVRIVAAAATPEQADQMADADVHTVRRILGPLVFGTGEDTLGDVVGAQLADRGLSLSVAESCTGGLLGAMITDVPGSSAYFAGGYVTYSNARKVADLGVDAELIERCGAVSGAVAEAMAAGCRARIGTDYALSITGIAGPDGGTADKPVGLVYVGLADPSGACCKRCLFSDRLDRAAIRRRSAHVALNLLRLTLRATT